MNYRISDKRLNGIINESLNDVILSEGWFGDSDDEKQRKERIQKLTANVQQIQDSVAKLEGRFETLQMNAAQGMYNQNQSANNAGNNGNAAAQTPDLKTLISAEYKLRQSNPQKYQQLCLQLRKAGLLKNNGGINWKKMNPQQINKWAGMMNEGRSEKPVVNEGLLTGLACLGANWALNKAKQHYANKWGSQSQNANNGQSNNGMFTGQQNMGYPFNQNQNQNMNQNMNQNQNMNMNQNDGGLMAQLQMSEKELSQMWNNLSEFFKNNKVSAQG